MKKTKTQKGITLIALIITIVILLILAVVSIGAVQNGGIITHAQNAASKMNKAQIQEKAELAKLEFITEAATDNTVRKSIQEFKNKLIETFEVIEDTNNDNIIEVNDKYAVVIKNTNLDIEVVEITDALKASSVVSLTYETNDNGDNGQVNYIDINLIVTKLMSVEEYDELKSSGLTPAEKERVAIAALESMFPGQTFNNIDEALVLYINSTYTKNYENIDECLNDTDTTVKDQLGTTKEQIYYSIFSCEVPSQGKEMSEEQVIDYLCDLSTSANNSMEFENYTQKLSLYVKIDGGEEKLISDSKFSAPKTIKYHMGTNSTYEFILKTEAGIEIVSEILQIKNIEKSSYVLTEQEASEVWTTNGNGTLTGYKGTDSEVVIPIQIGNENITKVGFYAFKDNDSSKNIIISEGITTIETAAFYGCTALTNISIPESITSIAGHVFQKCKNLTSVKLPEKITSIGEYTFDGCTELKEIIIPASVNSIGMYAFEDCANLTEIIIPNGITQIEAYTFYNCSKLQNITIPDGIIEIDGGAFRNCESLTKINLPDSVNKIGQFAFDGCKKLTNINIPESLTKIDNNVFSNCRSLISIKIPAKVKMIGMYAFENCINLAEVTIVEGLDSISSGAFNNCNSLTNLIIPSSVTRIGELAFCRCDKLTSIHFTGSKPSGQPWGATNATITPAD